MPERSPEIRVLAALGLIGLGVVIGLALGGRSERTIVVTGAPPPPLQTTTTPTQTQGTTPGSTTPTTTGPTVFRRPRSGEGVSDVTGTLQDVRFPEPSRGRNPRPGYTSFVIRPSSGPALRAGAPGDLRRDPNVPQELLEPACEGKVRARFQVAPVLYTGAFDYGVFAVRVVKDDCRGGDE